MRIRYIDKGISYFQAFIWVQTIGLVNFLGAFYLNDFYSTSIGRASVNAIALGIPIYFLGKSIEEKKISLGLKNKSSILYGFLIGISLFCIYELIYYLSYFVSVSNIDISILVEGNLLTNKMRHNALSILIVSPVLEEVFFRGVLVNRLSKKYQNWAVYIFISIVFTLAHIEYHFDFGYYTKLFFLSIVLCIFYDKSKSIVGTVLIHFTYNASFYAYRYITSKLLEDYSPPFTYVTLLALMILLSFIGIYLFFKKHTHIT